MLRHCVKTPTAGRRSLLQHNPQLQCYCGIILPSGRSQGETGAGTAHPGMIVHDGRGMGACPRLDGALAWGGTNGNGEGRSRPPPKARQNASGRLSPGDDAGLWTAGYPRNDAQRLRVSTAEPLPLVSVAVWELPRTTTRIEPETSYSLLWKLPA